MTGPVLSPGPVGDSPTGPGPGVPAPRRPGRAGGRDTGTSAIELAILLPLIIAALFSSIQVSVYFLARSEALGAAQEAVTAQRGYQAPAGAGYQRARQFLTGDGGTWLTDWTVTVDGTTSPTRVTATVTGHAISLIPGLDFTVTQTAQGSREQTTPLPPTPSGP